MVGGLSSVSSKGFNEVSSIQINGKAIRKPKPSRTAWRATRMSIESVRVNDATMRRAEWHRRHHLIEEVERLERADRLHHQQEEQRRREERQCDVSEEMPAIGAVDARRFVEVRWNRGEAGERDH